MSNESRERSLETLVTANRRFQQATDAIDQVACELLGVNRTDGRCLDILQLSGRITAGELAEAAGLSPGAVTTVLDRLERAGLARRVSDSRDRRRVLAEATEYSFEAAQRIYGPLGQMGASLLADMSDDDMRLVTRYLEAGAEIQMRRAAELRDQLDREGPLKRP
jgi:DNA-binding MarR family transcriptional regulator